MEQRKQMELAKQYVAAEMEFLPDNVFTLDQRNIVQRMLFESFNDGYLKGHNRGRLSGTEIMEGEVSKTIINLKSAFTKGL